MNPTGNKLLTPQQAAEILGLTVGTLQTWRTTKRYPLPYVKSGRLVKYRLADIEAFISRRAMNVEA